MGDAIKGFSWVGLFRVVTRGVSYVKIAIIARILTPAAYGSSDIALMILSLSEIITETGINIFLIQEEKNIDKYINTAWVVSIIRGVLIAIFIVISAPFVSGFFEAPGVLPLLFLVSLVPLVRGFINPSIVKFTKDLEFHKEFYYRTSIFIVEAVAAVVIAFVLRSPIAIVASLLVGAFFEVVLSFIIARPKPLFKFHKDIFLQVLHRGKWMTATGIMGYLYQNIDNFTVGRLLGVGNLGLYTRSYSISLLPITEITDTITKVTFPVYVKIAGDRNRLKRAFIKSMAVILSLIVPISSFFFFFPEIVIRIILGEQWLMAADALKVLAIVGAVRAITLSAAAPLYALKRQEYVTIITCVSLLGLLCTIIPFVRQWGLVGAGYAALVGSLVSLPVTAYFLYKIFNSHESEKKY